MTQENSRNLIGAILLVAGTAIGGGMLALPVLTAQTGFLPASLLLILSWLFMACTGTLLVEAYLWNEGEVNLISMAGKTLGRWGQIIAWILYLFLFYSLTTAYIAGGGNLFSDLLDKLFGGGVARQVGPLLFLILFGSFVLLGPKAVDQINRPLALGLFASFLIFILLGVKEIDVGRWSYFQFLQLPSAFLVVFTSFGYQGIVPTLTTYLGREAKKVRTAIWIGTAIALLIYLLWEALIFGVVPLVGLEDAMRCGQSAVYPLRRALGLTWLYGVGEIFAFFAIVTSFLGVTLGLMDFFRDGLKSSGGKELKNWVLGVLVFLPPLGFVLYNPCLFLSALNVGGGLGCALLLGLLPILMAWRGRYQLRLRGKPLLPGGRALLLLLLSYLAIVILVAFFVPS